MPCSKAESKHRTGVGRCAAPAVHVDTRIIADLRAGGVVDVEDAAAAGEGDAAEGDAQHLAAGLVDHLLVHLFAGGEAAVGGGAEGGRGGVLQGGGGWRQKHRWL